MYAADLRHENPTLQSKLEKLYALNRGKKIELSFRPQYLNLLQAFGNPHKKLPPVIHVAGTNGKGSVVAMLRAVLEEAGYKVHAYTSPHLYEFNERIRLAGKIIDDAALEQLIDRAVELNGDADITFFEITTAMAFAAFAAVPADILLLETGLGGRLDCTNIIENPLLTIITPISFDHMEFLGNTLEKIAAEKAGIMKPGVPCLTAQQEPSAMVVLQEKCAENGSELLFPRSHEFTPNLTGIHQLENAAIACAALEAISLGFPVREEETRRAFTKIEWPGRLERISSNPEIWYDGGHNTHAARVIAAQAGTWKNQDGKPLHLIIGMKADKDAGSFIAHLLPFAASAQVVPIPGIESVLSIPGAHSSSTLTRAINNTGGKGRILVCGSLYLAGPLRDSLKFLP